MVTRESSPSQPDDIAELAPLIRRVLEARVGHHDHVDELTQEVLARLLQTQTRLTADTLQAYAVITARNLAVSHHRKAERRRRRLPQLIDLRTPADPADEAIRNEEIDALREALGRLPTSDRNALVAHDLHDIDTGTLAAASDSTAGGVASKLNRIRGKLRLEYVLAVQRATLPTSRCRPVLVALSTTDRRRQAALNASKHLATCPTCAKLSPPLVERRRGALVLLPFPVIVERLLRPSRRWIRTHPTHTAVGAAVATAAVTAIIAVSSPPKPASPAPKITSPASVTAGTLTTGAGTSLLGLADNSQASSQVGQMITGTNVVVQVPIDLKNGFWVGSTPSDAYFVDLADPLPTTPTGPVVELRQGQAVSFTGELVANTPDYLNEARSDPVAGIDKIAAQGYHITATPDHVHPVLHDHAGPH